MGSPYDIWCLWSRCLRLLRILLNCLPPILYLPLISDFYLELIVEILELIVEKNCGHYYFGHKDMSFGSC